MGQGNENFNESLVRTLEELNNRLEHLERELFSSGRVDRGFRGGQYPMSRSERYGAQRYGYDRDEYRDYEQMQQGGRGYNMSRYDREFEGRPHEGRRREVEDIEDVDADQLSRLRAIQRRRKYSSPEETFGPVSGTGPGGQRAFSGERQGRVVEKEGVEIPLTKDGTIDERTEAGRILTDDQNYDMNQMLSFLDDPNIRTGNGSIDRRTSQGRALFSAGLIDEDGFPIEEAIEEVESGGEEEEEERGTRTASSRRRKGVVRGRGPK